MVTGRQSFLAVTNTIATVNDRWPAVVLSRVCRVRRLWKYHIIKRWLQPCFLKCSIRPLLIFLGNKEKRLKCYVLLMVLHFSQPNLLCSFDIVFSFVYFDFYRFFCFVLLFVKSWFSFFFFLFFFYILYFNFFIF